MKRIMLFFLLLVICSIVMYCAACAENTGGPETDMSYQPYLLKEAEVPQNPRNPTADSTSTGMNDEMRAQFFEWLEAKAEQQSIIIPDLEQIQDFICKSTRQLITSHTKKNFLFSPVSLWFCLHTVSELAAGNSRAQIWQVIGQPSEISPSEQSDALFRSLYWDDVTAVCAPAVSVWLNENAQVSQNLIDQLAKDHASVFQGRMGDEGFDIALQQWLDEQTRGLLDGSVSGIHFSQNDGFSVCSTLYLKNSWKDPFDKSETAPDVFHTETGDVAAQFMHSKFMGSVFQKSNFTAVMLDFLDGGGCLLILPVPGVSPAELLKENEFFHFLFSEKSWTGQEALGMIRLSMPKVDHMTSMSLREALEKMGITDLFDPHKAQFSAEITSDAALAVSDLQQHARLVFDEDGAEAAAITIIYDVGLPMQSEDEIEFTLDRPFLYVILSEKNIPLFIGTYLGP